MIAKKYKYIFKLPIFKLFDNKVSVFFKILQKLTYTFNVKFLQVSTRHAKIFSEKQN